MKSFKLEKSGDDKQTATSVGALLLILGLVITFVFHPLIGGAMVLMGIIALLAGKFAS